MADEFGSDHERPGSIAASMKPLNHCWAGSPYAHAGIAEPLRGLPGRTPVTGEGRGYHQAGRPHQNERPDDVGGRVSITDGAGVDCIVDVDVGGNLATSLKVLKTAACRTRPTPASRVESRARLGSIVRGFYLEYSSCRFTQAIGQGNFTSSLPLGTRSRIP